MAPMDDANTARIRLLEALAVTAELTGSEFSEAAARVMADDLEAYPLPQVIGALTRCRRELRGRLTVAAVIERLDDGRPGPNEAWAMIPQDERGSVVWTLEMAESFGIAGPLLAQGQTIAARSAFIEHYTASITRARAEQRSVQWFPSLGQDPGQREAALAEAVRKGRIGHDHAKRITQGPSRTETASNVEMLTAPRSPIPAKIKAQLLAFTGGKK